MAQHGPSAVATATPTTAPSALLPAVHQHHHHQQHLHHHHLLTASQPPVVVSLTAPRPDQARLHNEYVETPFRTQSAAPAVPPRPPPHPADTPAPAPAVVAPVADPCEGPCKPQHHHHHLTINRLQSAFGGAPPRTNTITKQPQSFKKSSSFNHHQASGPLSQPGISPNSTLPTTRLSRSTIRSSSPPMTMTLPLLVSNSAGGSPPPIPPSPSSLLSGISAGASVGSGGRVNGSIICPECGRCKCEACRTPRALPSTWLCKDTCLCSAEAVVDYASCLCCVKAAFYHCASDASAADDPCGCTGGGGHSSSSSLNGAAHGSVVSGGSAAAGGCGAGRYACLALFTLALPCLLCYWPLRLCHYMTESCYDRLLRRGCRCNYNNNNLNINNNHSRQQTTRSIHHNISSLSTTTTTRTPTASIAANLPTPEKRLLDSSGDTF